MEPHRRPAGRRALLPAEADLCNHVGLTEEEYWAYLAEVESFVHKRGKEYEHIPDIRADPVSLIVTLVIGVALQAVGALLAPKPKSAQEDERRPDLDVASERGRTRYTPSSNFDSVQSLANLGEVIPLIFCELPSRECIRRCKGEHRYALVANVVHRWWAAVQHVAAL